MRGSRPALCAAWLTAVVVAVAPAEAASSRGLVLAEAGRARVHITRARDASPAERTAADELARYLTRVTGAPFVIYDEAEVGQVGPAIHVGPTRTARATGPDPDRLGPEEWVVRVADRHLLLYGGRPRGTLYAVFRFLEDDVGVRWWSPFEETVPERPHLALGPLRRRGAPAFSYRDVHGVDGPRAFNARQRINGHFARLPWTWGGTERYGPPNPVHNFDNYVPPAEFGRSRPELFSEIDGERRTERSQLCLTHPALVDLVATRMAGHIERARREAEREGDPPPRLYGFSQNDRGYACSCAECRRVVEQEGAGSGPLVRFVAALAERIGVEYPEVLLDTLAYHFTFEAPQRTRLPDNVVVRLSALQYRDFAKPVTHRANEHYREVLAAWATRVRHLRIWDYTVTFGPGRDLPLPDALWLARDLRYYHTRGVEGVFVQHDHPISAHLRDLELWLLAKLLEDPWRDDRRLIAEFTEGYYGAAGPLVRRYLGELRRAARRRPSRVGYPARVEDHAHLDLRFVRRAHALFDRAEESVAGDPVRLRRVRHARLALDRATLLRLRDLRREWRNSGRSAGAAPVDVAAVVERYRRTWFEQIDLRSAEALRERHRDEVERELRGWLAELD